MSRSTLIWIVSLGLHGLLLLGIVWLLWGEPRRGPTILGGPVAWEAGESADPLREEIRPEIEEGRPIEEEDGFVEPPFIRDAKVSDHDETDSDQPFEESLGNAAFISDGPFEGPTTNAVIGTGGGAGGTLGGSGGRRNLVAGGAGGEPTTPGGPPASTWRPSSLVPNTSRLRVGDAESLPLEAVSVAVRVDGFRARVLLDLSYRNDRSGRLEGTFEVRLPEDASPFYLAFGAAEWKAGTPLTPVAGDFSVAGVRAAVGRTLPTVKEAVMARREKAARAYRETVRRRVDPALLEWSGAGIFSARVFPLEPGRTHHVVLGYDVSLVPAGDDLTLRLDLPAGAPERSVALTVAPGLAYEAGEWRGTASGETLAFSDPSLDAISVRIRSPGPSLLTGREPSCGDFFATSFTPALPADRAAGKPLAVFLVDVSLSSAPDRFRVYTDLLPAILSENRDAIREFAVLFFSVDAVWWRPEPAANTAENVADLLADLEAFALEGATDLGAALRTAAAAPFARQSADWFLLSDGAATWGGDLPRALPDSLFAFRTGHSGTDLGTLSRLCSASGGAVFAVTGPGDLREAARAYRRPPFRIVDVSVPGGTDLLLAGRPDSVYPGQRLTLAGRGRPAPDAEVVLRLARDGAESVVRVRPARVLTSALAPRLYGEIATAGLESLGEQASGGAAAYARQFRVVGPSASLVMLDSAADYARFGVGAEEDAETVRSWPVAARIAGASREESEPGAKERFLGWLRRLESVPGVMLRLPPELWEAAAAMTEEAFEIPSLPLPTRGRTRLAVPATLRDRLASGRVEYDEIVAEAARRLPVFGAADSLKALSSLVEAEPGDLAVARDVAFSALELGLPGPAAHLFLRAARARPHEPEALRLLARCLAMAGKPDLACLFFEILLAGRWDERFFSTVEVARMDYRGLLRRQGGAGLIPGRLGALGDGALPFPGLVVVLTWNTDATDVDLHVRDPRGEWCDYGHRRTSQGGRITRDVREGYGPEMFVLPRPEPGAYRVSTTFFAGAWNRTSTRTKILVTVIENGAGGAGRVTDRTAVLRDTREIQVLSDFTID